MGQAAGTAVICIVVFVLAAFIVSNCKPHFTAIKHFFLHFGKETNGESGDFTETKAGENSANLPNSSSGTEINDDKRNIRTQAVASLLRSVNNAFSALKEKSEFKTNNSSFSRTVDIFVWFGAIIVACITIASFSEVLINHHFGSEKIFQINPIKYSGSSVRGEVNPSRENSNLPGPFVEPAPLVYDGKATKDSGDLSCPCSRPTEHCAKSAAHTCHLHNSVRPHHKLLSQNNINISVGNDEGGQVTNSSALNTALSTAEIHVQFIQKWAEYDKIISQKVVGDILLLVIIIEILSLVKSLVDEGETSVPITLAIAVTSITRSLVQPQDNVASLGQPVISGMGEVLQGSAGVFLLVIAAVLAQRYLRPNSRQSDQN